MWETGDRLLAVHISKEEWELRAKTTHSTEIASAKKDDRTLEEILPRYCLAYKDVFNKKTFDELPPRMLGLRPQHNQSLIEKKGFRDENETRSLLRCNKQSQD